MVGQRDDRPILDTGEVRVRRSRDKCQLRSDSMEVRISLDRR